MIIESIKIPQYSHRYNNFNDLNADKPIKKNFLGFAEQIDINELLQLEQVFVIAEPGHGKTTLMEEIKTCFIKQKISYISLNGSDYNGELFESKNGCEYFIFDALDECKDVLPTFIEILRFCKENTLKLIISNRTHYLSMISHLLVKDSFVYYQLLPFSDEQIKTFMDSKIKQLHFLDKDYNEIIKRSKVNSKSSILSVPRYLDEFCKFILKEDKRAEDIKELTKTEIFEKVIYYKLEAEVKRKNENSNQKDLTKRVLERLSLVMEIQELNQISKEDFITFLDQTDSNISLIFLNLVNLDDLLDRVMKRTGDKLQFENSEFQEYLAAKELVRIGHRFQTIYDLMIDKDLQLLLPNWIDVLNFAIELQPEFVKPIIKFIQRRNHEGIDEKLVRIIMDVSPDNFDDKFRNLFFNTIFDYYKAKGKTIYNINDSLAKFVTKSNQLIFTPFFNINKLNDSVIYIQSNQILIIEELLKKGLLDNDQKAIWLDYLIKIVLKDEFRDMQSVAFHAFVALGNADSLVSIMKKFEHKNDDVLNNYLMALTRLIPDDIKVVGLINRIIKKGRKIKNLDDAINNLSSSNGIISIFKHLSNHVDRFKRDPYNYGNGFYNLFENIEKLDSNVIDNVVQKFVVKALNSQNNIYISSKILERSIIYLVKKRERFLIKILPTQAFLYSMDQILKSIISHINLKKFVLIENFLKNDERNWRLQRLIQIVRSEITYQTNNEILIYLDKKYPKIESNIIEAVESSAGLSKLEQLRCFFSLDSSFYYLELIPYYIDNYEDLKSVLNNNDKSALKEVVSIALRNYDPEKFTIEINRDDSYSYNSRVGLEIESYFHAALLLGELELIKTYREKLLKTLPRINIFFGQGKENISSLVKAILPITEEDEKMLKEYFMKKNDDTLVLHARNFAEMVEKFSLNELNPILFQLVKNENVHSLDKEEVLRTFGVFAKENDKNVLLEIVNSEKGFVKLKDIANAALIIRFRDYNAIIWRFDELRNRMQPFEFDHTFTGMRAVSEFEIEMESLEFPKCFYGIENETIYQQMLDLLTFSFSIRDKTMNIRYSNYLQQIVKNYFKTFLNAKVISDLKKTVSGFAFKEQTFSFNNYLDELISELRDHNKKEIPFLTSIQSLNHILNKIYLPINSNEELRELILNIIETDLKNLIENGGFYKLSNDLKENKNGDGRSTVNKIGEVIIQKTLQFALENALLKYGLRKTDILREVESLDGLRYDYSISYGLYGPIVVELKLLHNPEIQNDKRRDKYKEKMRKYLGANFGGIYAIFQIRTNAGHKEKYRILEEEYKDLNNLDITCLKCY